MNKKKLTIIYESCGLVTNNLQNHKYTHTHVHIHTHVHHNTINDGHTIMLTTSVHEEYTAQVNEHLPLNALYNIIIHCQDNLCLLPINCLCKHCTLGQTQNEREMQHKNHLL